MCSSDLITPVLQKKDLKEERFLSEAESWEALNETWAVFVGWAIWTQLEVERKGARELRSSGRSLNVPAWIARLSQAEQDASLRGYYEPEDPSEKAMARKRFLAPDFRLSAPELLLLMKEVLGSPADMIAELPAGKTLFAGYNPVRTGGPMQVSIAFAEEFARARAYPYPVNRSIRDEVFTRRGGLYFGSAILLDYPAPYDDVVYRFADFNAGRYSSRNAAFQAALAKASGKPMTLDGDLLRYRDGKPLEQPSEVEAALHVLSSKLRLSPREIRRDLLLEKSAAFGQSPLYFRLFVVADQAAGSVLPRQAMPQIDLKSPKISRKLTTEWFARRVDGRYRNCLARAGGG